MIKKVKITFDRYRLMQRVIMQAQKVCNKKSTIQALRDALAELVRVEAVELTDQFASGHKDHNRRRKLPYEDDEHIPYCECPECV